LRVAVQQWIAPNIVITFQEVQLDHVVTTTYALVFTIRHPLKLQGYKLAVLDLAFAKIVI